jgi:alpha-L-fucosidase
MYAMICFVLVLSFFCLSSVTQAEEGDMDAMWGERTSVPRAEDAARGQLFRDGNYAMFIHFGLYANLANKVDGKTYYGIGEWIMHDRMAGIPVPEYKALAANFNPVNFDAAAIAQLAKDAGMKYIIITSKHHDGFAMYHSKVSPFNIVDATPYGKDPMKELAAACREVGIGFGFYYSHWQDWTAPGGGNGLTRDAHGDPAAFEDYFKKKCLPQVEEITTEYGDIELVWFDTPGGIPKEYVEELVAVVRKNQPDALVSGRAGHGLGDYETNGDMHIPYENIEGMWETVDTTNDSWAFAWYDEYWKSPKEVLRRLIATVGRGGTYMLNIGPRGDGSIPERAQNVLRAAGAWIQRYPQVVYGAASSPWGHALPWGDVTVQEKTLLLSIFDWPASGKLYLPGLKTPVASAHLCVGDKLESVTFEKENGWLTLNLPPHAPEQLVSVVALELTDTPEADATLGLDPNLETEVLMDFATVSEAKKEDLKWMEKFGEWKEITRVHQWEESGKATWEIEVHTPGEYNVDLRYAGEGRIVWAVDVEDGEHIQNQQNSSHNYQKFPLGWINFPTSGHYRISVSCLEGDLSKASLQSIHFKRVVF